jgi:hypothetical protein
MQWEHGAGRAEGRTWGGRDWEQNWEYQRNQESVHMAGHWIGAETAEGAKVAPMVPLLLRILANHALAHVHHLHLVESARFLAMSVALQNEANPSSTRIWAIRARASVTRGLKVQKARKALHSQAGSRRSSRGSTLLLEHTDQLEPILTDPTLVHYPLATRYWTDCSPSCRCP